MQPQSTIARWGSVQMSLAGAMVRAMRPWQWLKNLLVFAPLLAAQSVAIGGWRAAVIGFAALSLAASAMYLINDIVDVDHDRRHPGKCRRPFAAGELGLRTALVLSAVLLLTASGLALFVSLDLLGMLWLYGVAAMVYSLRVKRIAVLDVMLLSGLFLLRVFAGGVATGIEISFWMMAFFGALFMSLSLVKRCAELTLMQAQGSRDRSARPYRFGDLPLLQTAGLASGIASSVVLMLYIGSPEVAALYSTPVWLWGVLAAQLFWVMKAWYLTRRGAMHEDPVVHAASNPGSLLSILCCAACLYLAL